jgi:hypothetical protein
MRPMLLPDIGGKTNKQERSTFGCFVMQRTITPHGEESIFLPNTILRSQGGKDSPSLILFARL